MTSGEENPYVFVDVDENIGEVQRFIFPKNVCDVQISYKYPEDHMDRELRKWEKNEEVFFAPSMAAGILYEILFIN